MAGTPSVIRGMSAHIRCGNAGGTAEGVPFVPSVGSEGLLFLQPGDSQCFRVLTF